MNTTLMKPGQELDVLIAEKVMCLLVKYEDQPYEISPRNLHPGDEYTDKYGTRVLPYSTDIAAAWQVVEKLKLSIGWSGIGKWVCSINSYDLYGDPTSYADTAPHAICLAALKAVNPQS